MGASFGEWQSFEYATRLLLKKPKMESSTLTTLHKSYDICPFLLNAPDFCYGNQNVASWKNYAKVLLLLTEQ